MGETKQIRRVHVMRPSSEVHLKSKATGEEARTLPQVLKRDGRKQSFDMYKVEKSIRKAAEGIEGIPIHEIEHVIEKVVNSLSSSKEPINTQTISDSVEKSMVEMIVENPTWEEAAKRYVLARIYNQVYGKGAWKEFDPHDLKITYNALKVLEARYLLKDPETRRYIETPQKLFMRVARFIASAEKPELRDHYEKLFYEFMSSLRFMPNTPTLMNAGTRNGVLSACYVIPVRDSIVTPEGEGIHDALRAQALIQQQGGGTGFDFSELRPEGDVVRSTAGVASGPLSFMRLFDVNTEVIKQGGKRRGANMGILHVWHPDIKRFIRSKTGELKDVHLQNFNISVGIYDKFMEAVEKGEKWPLINPRKTSLVPGKSDSRYYAIVRARHSIEEEWVQEEIIRELEEKGGSVPLDETRILTWEEALAIAEDQDAIVEWVDARELFNMITFGAWDSGDPGVVFIDEMNRRHPAWYLGKINATNPCSEQPLLDWESCNLGSINLEAYVKTGEDGKPTIDWDALARDVKLAIRFLDNVIDKNRHPLPQITEANLRTRKVGLGIMGWAHMLARLRIPYDSPEAIFLGYKVAEWIAYNASIASIELAAEKGTFPAFDRRLYRPLWRTAPSLEELARRAGLEVKEPEIPIPAIDWSKVEELYEKHGIRNATILSIAPTGTISIISGTSSGIEPIFALAFLRLVSVGSFIEIDRTFLQDLKREHLDSEWVIRKIAENGSVQDADFIPDWMKEVYKTAYDVSPLYHILHQAVWQAWCDTGVSKTINMKNEERQETVDMVYKLAWKLGIKGTTVYRDKSKSMQVLNKGIKREEKREGNGSTTTKQKTRETRMAPKKLRIGKQELIAVEEDYAGGCPTCEV